MEWFLASRLKVHEKRFLLALTCLPISSTLKRSALISYFFIDLNYIIIYKNSDHLAGDPSSETCLLL